jgi:hypothetical protein
MFSNVPGFCYFIRPCVTLNLLVQFDANSQSGPCVAGMSVYEINVNIV